MNTDLRAHLAPPLPGVVRSTRDEGLSGFALSIDVEDYFHVSAFERVISPHSWDSRECRVENNVNRLLELLAQQQTQATFFILGWVAERYPALVRRIADENHEVASHGFGHQRINNLDRDAFRNDIRGAKALLEDLTGARLSGYRAPSFSFSEDRPWIQDELLAAGYHYSSSINPVPHDLYGYPDAPRTPFLWSNGLLEIPVATCQLFQRRIPCAGGGYFRLYPYALSRHLIRRAATQLQGPVVFYLHPWEIDAEQPYISSASAKSKFRHYINLRRTFPRLEKLLVDFPWGRICDLGPVKPFKD